MSPLTKIAAILATVGCLLPAYLPAQDWLGRGRVEGRVVDTEDRPVEGATIRVHKPGQPEEGPDPVTSGRNGRWALLGIAGGAWTVSVEKEGYQPVSGDFQLVEQGRNPPINVELAPIPEELIRAQELDEAVQRVEEANRLLAAGDYAEARARYEEALPRLEPEHRVAVLRAIAHTHFQEGDPRLAEGKLREALELDSHDVEALQLLITLLVSDGREEEAEVLAERLPADAAMDPVSLLNLGIRRFNEGDHETAHGYFQRAIEADPELADSYYYFGLTAMAQGLTEEARQAFERLLELAPEHEHAEDARGFLEYL
jgi:tetratricopeptide (TPR) repeat protein